jgi:hypothetical protein
MSEVRHNTLLACVLVFHKLPRVVQCEAKWHKSSIRIYMTYPLVLLIPLEKKRLPIIIHHEATVLCYTPNTLCKSVFAKASEPGVPTHLLRRFPAPPLSQLPWSPEISASDSSVLLRRLR